MLLHVRIPIAVAVAVAVVMSAVRLPAQSSVTAGAVRSLPVAAAPRVLEAREAHSAIVLDGRLDEPEWLSAPVATEFTQSEPQSGAPATERTEVRVLYDAERLYIGAYLHDRAPDDIVVNDIRKDFTPEQQDVFEVILDTFHDRRNGYIFSTNLAGARADRQVANEGREINTSWDGLWTVQTRRVDDGWVVEMAIPFRTLRFDFSRATSWGINFSRRIRRRNEVSFWSPVPRAYTLARVSLAGELTGIAHSGTARDLRIKPYVAARTTRETGGLQIGTKGDAGVDVKYGVTQGLTLDLTVNPDFAQAEADEQQVNLTQFSQFFPEKREFFLENSGIFYVGDAARNNRVSLAPTADEDMLLFFSRRIGLSRDGRNVAIPAGLRLTGSGAGVSVGALSMQTQASAATPASQYSVLRLRRNLFAGSDIGVVVLDREGLGVTSPDWNRVVGADANFRLPGEWDWNSYGVGSRKPEKSGGQYAYRSSLSHEGNFFHGKVGVLEIGSGFSDDLGYFRRTDTRKYILDTGLRPRPSWLAGTGVREMHPHLTWNYYENLHGGITAKNLHSGYTVFLDDGGFMELSVNPNFQRIDTPFRISPSIDPIPAGSYAWQDYQLKGGTNASRMVSVTYTFITGGLWSGRQQTQQLAMEAHPTAQLAASVGVSHTAATLESPQASFEALLWTTRASYSFTTNMFLDALAQYDPRQRVLNANVRFNVIHHPLSNVFIVLDEQRITTPDAPIAGFAVIVKATQTLSF
jgi:hypothetical protein